MLSLQNVRNCNQTLWKRKKNLNWIGFISTFISSDHDDDLNCCIKNVICVFSPSYLLVGWNESGRWLMLLLLLFSQSIPFNLLKLWCVDSQRIDVTIETTRNNCISALNFHNKIQFSWNFNSKLIPFPWETTQFFISFGCWCFVMGFLIYKVYLHTFFLQPPYVPMRIWTNSHDNASN